MKLVTVNDIKNEEIMSFQKEFKRNKEILHGGNGLVGAKNIEQWKKGIKKLEIKPAKNQVKTQQFLIIDKSAYLVGVIDFKYYLLPYQEINGGHVSYSIRKSERGKGYAREALENIKIFARKHTDLKEIILTCDEKNILSKKVILSCGGVYQKQVIINKRIIEHYIINL